MATCDHCLSEFSDRDALRDDLDGRQKIFCCNGCLGIYRLIHGEGLGRFYERRGWESVAPPFPAAARGIDYSPFAGLVREVGEGKEIDLVIDRSEERRV